MGRSRAYTFFGLTALGVGSVAALLLVSVTRWFLPGVVELSAVLAVAAAVAAVAGARNHASLVAWAQRVSWRSLKIAAAGVAVLTLSAGLALAFDGFPWPVALLAGTVTVLIAAADGSSAQATGGASSARGDAGPAPAGPTPRPDGAVSTMRTMTARTLTPPLAPSLPALSGVEGSRGPVVLTPPGRRPAFARQPVTSLPRRRSPAYARQPCTARPRRRALPCYALPCQARSRRFTVRPLSPVPR